MTDAERLDAVLAMDASDMQRTWASEFREIEASTIREVADAIFGALVDDTAGWFRRMYTE